MGRLRPAVAVPGRLRLLGTGGRGRAAREPTPCPAPADRFSRTP